MARDRRRAQHGLRDGCVPGASTPASNPQCRPFRMVGVGIRLTTVSRQRIPSPADRESQNDGAAGASRAVRSIAAEASARGARPVFVERLPQLRSCHQPRLARFVIDLRHERLARQDVVTAVLQKPRHLQTGLDCRHAPIWPGRLVASCPALVAEKRGLAGAHLRALRAVSAP